MVCMCVCVCVCMCVCMCVCVYVPLPVLTSIIERTFHSLTNQVSDVLVRTRFTETLCPLLSKMQRDPIAVEQEIRDLLGKFPVGVCVVLCVLWHGVRFFVVLYCVLSYDIIISHPSASRASLFA